MNYLYTLTLALVSSLFDFMVQLQEDSLCRLLISV